MKTPVMNCVYLYSIINMALMTFVKWQKKRGNAPKNDNVGYNLCLVLAQIC